MLSEKPRAIVEGVVLLLVSTVLARTGVAAFIFPAPLLLYAISHGRKSAALLIAVEMALLLVLDLFGAGVPGTRTDAAFFLIAMYIPLSLSAAGIMWLAAKGTRLLKRLFLTLLPAIVFLSAISAFIVSDRALPQILFEDFRNAFAVAFAQVFGGLFPSIDIEMLSYIVIIGVLSFLFPAILCGICASAFIYESVKHSRESMWEEAVMRFSYPGDAVWGFIVSWALVLLLRFVSVPVAVPVIALNVAGIWTVLYAIQGFTVVFARVRKHSRNVRSMTVFIIVLFAGTLIPGINFIVVLGLPLIGVLETFFDLKKLGVENEDHS